MELISESEKTYIKEPLSPLHSTSCALSLQQACTQVTPALRSKTVSKKGIKESFPTVQSIQPGLPSPGSPTIASSLCNWAGGIIQSD